MTNERELLEKIAEALRESIGRICDCYGCCLGREALAAYDSYISQQAPLSDYGHTHCSDLSCGADLGHEGLHAVSVNVRTPGTDGHDEDCPCHVDFGSSSDPCPVGLCSECTCGKREVKESL